MSARATLTFARAARGLASVVAVAAITLLLVEVFYRLLQGVSLFSFPDFRLTRAITVKLSDMSDYDPVLGWRVKPNLDAKDFHTIEYGVRWNGRGERKLQPGGVLTVGASFTAGAEVNDDQSWPSQFELMVGQPVVNAAVGGFGSDQLVLLAEQMLPIARPKLVILDLVSNNILTAGYSYSGRPKPYFDVVEGKLVARNTPVPATLAQEATGPLDFLKYFLGYSYAAEMVMESFFPDFWFRSPSLNFLRANNDEVDVTCRLLDRLKTRLDAAGTRLLVNFQYGGGELATSEALPGFVGLVQRCAVAMGIQIVDEFAALRKLYLADPARLRALYVMHDNGRSYGHKSVAGNRDVAERIFAALGESPAPARRDLWQADGFVPGDGHNLIPRAEALDGGGVGAAQATFAAVGDAHEKPRRYALTAAGNPGEHYVTAVPGSQPQGAYTLSIELHAQSTSRARLQLLDAANNGVIADLDLAAGTGTWARAGAARGVTALFDVIRGDWLRARISVVLPEKDARVIVQLADGTGNVGFPAAGESIQLRAVQLEHGQTASPYRAALQ